jgi:high affinity Mn2+ porin
MFKRRVTDLKTHLFGVIVFVYASVCFSQTTLEPSDSVGGPLGEVGFERQTLEQVIRELWSGEASKQSSALELSWLSLHGQLTFLNMWHPAVKNASTNQVVPGTNSLQPSTENKETFDTTFLVGIHLSESAAFFINPEIDQGYGFTDTLGIAGFPNGAAYKVGQFQPYGRIPRAFYRQTLNLGGEAEFIEEGPNQFAKEITHNNLTLTAGKFSVVDVFDTNRYAHDPRADFLNWSIVDSGAFDYAADSWGFTYGLALELRQENWTLRAGLFDLSNVPNSEILDSTFKQFEMVSELERRHQFAQREGSLKLLGFVNRGNMGSYSDAVNLALNSGTTTACPSLAMSEPPSTACVRHHSQQGGLAINLEQELSPTLGLFAKLSANQGKKETFEFTDINQSFATGLVFQGVAWGRGGDTVGVAGVVNGLSEQARSYFSAGGMGVLVGDGWLNYGQEKITELFYNSHLTQRLSAALDVQYVINPAYNRDRGPVSIVGARVHYDF